MITPEVAEYIKKEAEKNLAENTTAHPSVIEHWQKVAAGEIPFGLTVADE